MRTNLRRFVVVRESLRERGATIAYTMILSIGVVATLSFSLNVALLATSSRQQYAISEYVAQAALSNFISQRNGATVGNANIFKCNPPEDHNDSNNNSNNNNNNNNNNHGNNHNDDHGSQGTNPSTCNPSSQSAKSAILTQAATAAIAVGSSNRATLSRSTVTVTPSNLTYGYCPPDDHHDYLFNACTWGEPQLSNNTNPNSNPLHIENINAVRASLDTQQQQLIMNFIGVRRANLHGGTATVVWDARRNPSSNTNPSKDNNNISTKSFILADLR